MTTRKSKTTVSGPVHLTVVLVLRLVERLPRDISKEISGTPPRIEYYGPEKNQRKPRNKREPKPEPEWTTLNRSRADILKEVKGKPFYYPPKPLLAPPENRSRDKHYGYHEDHGHTNEDCFSFKIFIEEQIKKGNMNQYVHRKPADKDKAPGGRKHVVNVVLGGTSSPTQSPYMDNDVMMIQPFEDEPIYFSYDNYEGLDVGHNQELVMTLDVADNEICNGNDEGSSASKRDALQQLVETSVANDHFVWTKYFNQILTVVLEILDDLDSSIREFALLLVVEMLKNQKDPMGDFVEIVIEKLLHVTKDHVAKVANEAG
ncbi:hypothetical protein AgCh_008706 [Apium graveolens]